MPKRKVIWIADFSGSSPSESAGFAMECGMQAFGNATIFLVDGERVDMEGDDPSGNGHCYDDMVVCSRDDLVAAFTRWHAACPKDARGHIAGVTSDDPNAITDILLGYLNAPKSV
jgi:hypothetical protein